MIIATLAALLTACGSTSPNSNSATSNAPSENTTQTDTSTTDNKTESNIDKKLIKIEIDKISREINEVRKEVVLCKDIEERSSILRNKLEQYEKELQKEERKDMVK